MSPLVGRPVLGLAKLGRLMPKVFAALWHETKDAGWTYLARVLFVSDIYFVATVFLACVFSIYTQDL